MDKHRTKSEIEKDLKGIEEILQKIEEQIHTISYTLHKEENHSSYHQQIAEILKADT